MDFKQSMRNLAREYQHSLVLPEGTEVRTLSAAVKIMAEKLATAVTVLGPKSEIEALALEKGLDISNISIVDPMDSEWADEFATKYCKLRAKKGMTPEQAVIDMKDCLRFGAMMVKMGKSDAMVAGARSSTADVLRAGLTIIGTAADSKTASSCFVMDTHNDNWGYKGLLIFSDCAVLPNPSAEQLADIAIGASHSCESFLGVEPIVAMLSFSTNGSGGKNESVLKVVEATKMAKEHNPKLLIDGEMQLDAALIPEVTLTKYPESAIRNRKVNTLVFPDLNAGNIGYKLVQRLAGADAYGPILQGFALPISDLSRGCSVEDIITTSAITLVQAGHKKS